MTLVDAKYDNFTHFIHPLFGSCYLKNDFLWYILASSGIKQSKLQRAGPNRSFITDFQQKMFLVFIVIFETFIMLFIKSCTHDIIKRVSFKIKHVFLYFLHCMCVG